MTEKEKMLSGELYDPSDPSLLELRTKAHDLCRKYNQLPENDSENKLKILQCLIPDLGEYNELVAPVFFDYGCNVKTGKNTFINANFVALDCANVDIGNNVFIGTGCSVLTPMHPMLPQERNMRRKTDGSFYNLEYAKPIVIEDDCWIAGSVTICGGVRIGKGTVIGAGSVVTRNIPENSFAAGNPCRVIRTLGPEDSMSEA